MLSKTINMRRKSNSEDDSRILFPIETHALKALLGTEIFSQANEFGNYHICAAANSKKEKKRTGKSKSIDSLTFGELLITTLPNSDEQL